MSDESRRFWRWVAVAVALCTVISWAAIYFSNVEKLWGDGYYWHHAGNLLAEGKGFILPLHYIEAGIEMQSADHPPLFIVYLSAFSVVGLDSEGWHQFATALITLAAVLSFAIVGRRLGGTAVGIVAGFVAAIHPVIWGWNKMIMSEPLAVLAVVWLLWSAVDWRDKAATGTNTWLHAARFGTVIGLAALTRSELLLLGVLLAAVSMFLRPVLRTLVPLSIAGTATLVTFAPWIGHNLTRFEEPVYLSIGANGTLAATNCDAVYGGEFLGYWDINCTGAAQERAAVELAAVGIDDPDQSQIIDQMGGYWRDYMLDNIEHVPKVIAARLGRVLGLYRPFQQMSLDHFPEGRDRHVVYGAWAMYAALIPLSVAGGRVLRRRGRLLALMLLPIPAALFTVAITFGNTRYRIAAEPAMILLGSIGIVVVARGLLTLWREPDEPAPSPTSRALP